MGQIPSQQTPESSATPAAGEASKKPSSQSSQPAPVPSTPKPDPKPDPKPNPKPELKPEPKPKPPKTPQPPVVESAPQDPKLFDEDDSYFSEPPQQLTSLPKPSFLDRTPRLDP